MIILTNSHKILDHIRTIIKKVIVMLKVEEVKVVMRKTGIVKLVVTLRKVEIVV